MTDFIKKETVFCISAVAAIISTFIVPPDLKYLEYINFRVLGLLFSLMAVVCGLRQLKVFDIIARRMAAKCSNMRLMVFVLTAIPFFASMLITNDVALITFVPLAISMLKIAGGEKYIVYTVVLQTVAANMGSVLTPMGNPQNLYLADFYNMNIKEFFGTTAPLCILSGVLNLIFILRVKKEPVLKVNQQKEKIERKFLCMYTVLGIIAMMSVFGVMPYTISVAITAIILIIFDRTTLIKVDWFLLFTFIMFFIFVGNASRMLKIRSFLETVISERELFAGIIVSQIISNVPAAVMLSTFTSNGRMLLLGVDIGGLGTPVASLASLISYRLYCKYSESKKGEYMACFLSVNFIMLFLITIAAVILFD